MTCRVRHNNVQTIKAITNETRCIIFFVKKNKNCSTLIHFYESECRRNKKNKSSSGKSGEIWENQSGGKVGPLFRVDHVQTYTTISPDNNRLRYWMWKTAGLAQIRARQLPISSCAESFVQISLPSS